MERYTPEERGIIVTAYLTNSRSIVLTQRAFRRCFPRRPAPCAQTIRRLAERLAQTGSTKDVARSGRPRTARSIENITAVAEDVKESPQTPLRQRCRKLGISRRSLHRILVKDLKMSPCGMKRPMETGDIKVFNRIKGHGSITPHIGGEELFVHISDIEGTYVPLPGDEVKYRLCTPKSEKHKAVDCQIINLNPEVHHKWEERSAQKADIDK